MQLPTDIDDILTANPEFENDTLVDMRIRQLILEKVDADFILQLLQQRLDELLTHKTQEWKQTQ